MKKMTLLLIVVWTIIGAAALTVLIYGIANGGSYTGWSFDDEDRELLFDRSFPLSGIETVELSLGSDTVNFYRAEGSEIIVRQYGQNLREERIIEASTGGGTLSISRKSNMSSWISFGFNISRSWVEVYLPDSYSAKLDLHLSSGTIDLNAGLSLEELLIRVSSGTIRSEEMLLAETAELKVSSGSIRLGELRAQSANLNVTSGVIQLETLESGLFEIETSSGQIKVETLIGTGRIDVTSGTVTVSEFHIGESFDVEVSSGTVRVTVAGTPSLKFEGKISSGTLNTYFDTYTNSGERGRHFAGVGSGPYKPFTVSVTSGTVRIDQNASVSRSEFSGGAGRTG